MKKTILGLAFILAGMGAYAQKKDTTFSEVRTKLYPVSLSKDQWGAIIGVLDEYCPDIKQGDAKAIKKWILEPVNRQLFVEDSLSKIKPIKQK